MRRTPEAAIRRLSAASAMFVLLSSLFLTLSPTGMASSASATSSASTTTAGPSSVFLRNSSYNSVHLSSSVPCTLSDVITGDLLVITVTSSEVPGSAMSANDTVSDSFSYFQNWSFGIGTGAAFAQASTGGIVTITASVGNSGADLLAFCYDVAGASTVVSNPQGTTGNGTQLSVQSFTISPNSFVVAQYLSDGLTVPVFAAGPGFIQTEGSPLISHGRPQPHNFAGSEWGIANAGGSTTCPMTQSVSQFWGGICLAFSPVFTQPSPILVQHTSSIVSIEDENGSSLKISLPNNVTGGDLLVVVLSIHPLTARASYRAHTASEPSLIPWAVAGRSC